MRVKVICPRLEEAAGTLAVQQPPGAQVAPGEILGTIASGAWAVALTAPDAGTLAHWRKGAGATVEAGELLAEIEQPQSPGNRHFRPAHPGQLMIRTLLEGNVAVPQVTASVDVDMTATKRFREEVREGFNLRTGIAIGFTPFLVKAAAEALQAVPRLNASVTRSGLWLHERIHIGVPVNTPAGAHVPVIRDADRKSTPQIAIELADKSRRARAGGLGVNDVIDTTFTLSNPGGFGIVRDVPMVTPPSVGALTCGAIVERPVVREERVVVRPIMAVSLSFDHRAVDGEEAGLFLHQFRTCLEEARF